METFLVSRKSVLRVGTEIFGWYKSSEIVWDEIKLMMDFATPKSVYRTFLCFWLLMRWCTFDPKQAATATTSTKMFFENTKSSASIFKTLLLRGGWTQSAQTWQFRHVANRGGPNAHILSVTQFRTQLIRLLPVHLCYHVAGSELTTDPAIRSSVPALC